MLLVINIGLG